MSKAGIKDRSQRMAQIEWRKCEWLQPKEFKTITDIDFMKLVASIQENDFADPFRVWQDTDGTIWILDGHHRQKALEYCLENEERKPPEKLSAIFMACKDKKDAAKLCLVYAAEYARIEEQGLYDYMKIFDIGFDDIKSQVVLPGIDIDSFEVNFSKEPDLDNFENVSDDLKGFQVKDFGYSDFETEGYFQMPVLRSDMLGEIPKKIEVWTGRNYENYTDCNDWLWVYGSSGLKGIENFDNVVMGFYVDDHRFENFYVDYQKYIAKILNLGIKTVIMPNFSIWTDESKTIQAYNSYKSKWVARIMQEVGLMVIPDINYGDETSYDFCFDGLPVGARDVCVQAQNVHIDNRKEVDLHIRGIKAAYEKLKFKRLWVYTGGEKKEKMYDIFNKFEVKFITSFTYKRRKLKGERDETKN